MKERNGVEKKGRKEVRGNRVCEKVRVEEELDERKRY